MVILFQYLMYVRMDFRLTWILSLFKCQIEQQTETKPDDPISGFDVCCKNHMLSIYITTE
jgi:hypothetical protein